MCNFDFHYTHTFLHKIAKKSCVITHTRVSARQSWITVINELKRALMSKGEQIDPMVAAMNILVVLRASVHFDAI